MGRSAFVLVLLLAGNVIAWSAAHGRRVETTAPAVARESTYRTEQEWIVTDIASAIVGMTLRSAGGGGDEAPAVNASIESPSPAAFAIAVANGQPQHLKVVGNLWAPETYLAFADSLMRTDAFLLRRIAVTSDDYEQSMIAGRELAIASPQLISPAVWTFMPQRPAFRQQAMPFPFFIEWFNPTVPTGAALDLDSRALLPGCPRPPTPAEAKAWAEAAPYEHWTVWSAAYLAGDRAKPTYETVRRAFGALLEYDYMAVEKVIDYIDMSSNDRIEAARTLCRITRSKCDRLAFMLVQQSRESEAEAVYERWIAETRNRVRVSNSLTWLVRRYQNTGRSTRAEEIARMAADTGSLTGLETLGHLLDAQGRYDEAERVYRRILDRYEEGWPLGAFFVRQALRNGDRPLEFKGWELLRAQFPTGMEHLGMYALDTTPTEGVAFGNFGRRAQAAGLRPMDVVISVDGWRVRSVAQYTVASRLRHDDNMTFIVWRNGRYQEIRTRVAERWMALPLQNYRGTPGHR